MSNEEGTLKGRIEAILFVAGEAVSLRDLSRALQAEEKDIRKAMEIQNLAAKFYDKLYEEKMGPYAKMGGGLF